MTSFAQPYWFCALLALPLLWRFLVARGHVGFSDCRLLQKPSRRARALAALPVVLATATYVLVVCALARPQVPGEPIQRTIPGRDIIMAVDISASMGFSFKGELAPHKVPKELDFQAPHAERRKGNKFQLELPNEKKGLHRIDAAQDAILRFIENRWRGQTGDRMGLILFDERPRYGWPLTDDLRMIYRKGQFVTQGLGMGTNFGEHPPGPIDLALEHFKDVGQAQSRVLIMVTDGEDQMSGYTQMRLTKILRENNIRLYLIGIGETLARKDVDIIRLASQVDGKVFRVEDTSSLEECFKVIDQMEKSAISVSQIDTSEDVFHYFAWAALVSLALLLVAEAIILTR